MDDNKALDVMVRKIITAIKKLRDNSSDQSFKSVCYGKDEKGNYKIVYEGRLRSVQNSLPCEITSGTLVWVKIPCGQLKDMHICGLRYK